jgi:triosephosphate isomerase
MAQRRTVIAANWKMNMLREDALEYLDELASWWDERGHDYAETLEVVIAPPFTLLDVAVERNAPCGVFAQNMSQFDSGAYTGEISPAMLRDAGVHGVILGHSERRQLYGETDVALAEKLQAALAFRLRPMLCVGETIDERRVGNAETVVEQQLRGALTENVDAIREQADRVYLAYEPVWAIGTGETATPEQAQQMHAHVRSVVADLLGNDIATQIPILYGGSVKPGNAAELLANDDIDGALVGGASLSMADFGGIMDAGAQRALAGAAG